jgi:hypothetical protein
VSDLFKTNKIVHKDTNYNILAYGTYFFEMANVGNAFENSCILTALGVVAILVNIAVVTRIGRRRLFLTVGLIICGSSQLIVAIIYTIHPGTQATGKAIVGLSVIFIFAYNGMISTYAWVSGGELPSQRLRSYTFGFAAAIGFLGAVSERIAFLDVWRLENTNLFSRLSGWPLSPRPISLTPTP